MNVLYALQEKYLLPRDDFKQKIDSLDKFQVVTPVVGKFSAGKSSLLNALLGKNANNRWYLGTNLTPETSVPTEICYATVEKVLLFKQTNEITTIDLNEFIGRKFTVEDVKKVGLFLNQGFLKTVSTVKIVDMPGFDSGIELHNRAIDDYLPQAHSYILAFAATEPVIPESIANFLRELHLHDMPVYIVITKSNSVSKEQLDLCVKNIKSDAKRYLGIDDVNIVCTNAKGRNIEIEGLKNILQDIESASNKLFAQYAGRIVRQEAGKIVIYLRSIVKQAELMPSELATQEEKYRLQIEHLEKKLARTKEDFSRQVDNSIANVSAQVQQALNNSVNMLTTMLLQRMDITYKVNMLVRETVITAVKKDFEPRLQRYIQKVTRDLHVDVGDLGTYDFLSTDDSQMFIDSTVQESLKKSLPAILSVIGISLTGPIGAIVGMVLGLFIDKSFAQRQQNAQRQMAQNKLVNDIIPQIVSRANESVSQSIHEQVTQVHQAMEDDIRQQIELQQQALSATKKAYKEEKDKREKQLAEIKTDLATVEAYLA